MENISVADAKIHILYLVESAPGVSYQMLMNKCMESLYVDFFAFTQAYEELIAGNLMNKSNSDNGTGEAVGGTETLTITEGGRAVLNDLKGTLNNKFEGYLRQASSELSEELKEISQVTATYEYTSNGKFVVTLKSTKNSQYFETKIEVDSKEQAVEATKAWRSNSSDIISSMKSSLGI